MSNEVQVNEITKVISGALEGITEYKGEGIYGSTVKDKERVNAALAAAEYKTKKGDILTLEHIEAAQDFGKEYLAAEAIPNAGLLCVAPRGLRLFASL